MARKSRRRIGGRTDKAERALSSGVSFELDDSQFDRVIEQFTLSGVETGMQRLESFGLEIAYTAQQITSALHGPFKVRPKVTRNDDALSVTIAYPRVRKRSHAILAKSLKMAAVRETSLD